ncbi:MAG: hypothetical protein PW843_28510 [Azospirillaceae bacterium]|nr:hypothetical protein [Azospirillaceae bacterium]
MTAPSSEPSTSPDRLIPQGEHPRKAPQGNPGDHPDGRAAPAPPDAKPSKPVNKTGKDAKN